MKMIWAVVRLSKVDAIARALKRIGVSGCTIYPVRGYGEEWHLYEPLIHGGHHKIEASSRITKWKRRLRKSLGRPGRAWKVTGS